MQIKRIFQGRFVGFMDFLCILKRKQGKREAQKQPGLLGAYIDRIILQRKVWLKAVVLGGVLPGKPAPSPARGATLRCNNNFRFLLYQKDAKWGVDSFSHNPWINRPAQGPAGGAQGPLEKFFTALVFTMEVKKWYRCMAAIASATVLLTNCILKLPAS